MESFTRIESFTDFDDSTYFLDNLLREMAAEGWEVQQGSGIQYVNHQWRVGVNWERPSGKKDEQLLPDLPGLEEPDV